jgi:protease I
MKPAKTRGSRTPKVAILVTDGFEETELTGPRTALDRGGFATYVVSPNPSKVKGVVHGKPGLTVRVDVPLRKADAGQYVALLLPGGVMNPDALRMEPAAVRFVKSFFKAGKPVGAICHGPIMLIEAGVLKGRHITSYPSIQTDVRNAGGRWTNKAVVVDGNLVTSRQPADIPAFNRSILKAFGGRRTGRK